MASRWVHACDLAAFDDRPTVGVTVDDTPLVIVRDGTRFFAAERACPHEGADLARGRCVDMRLHCPRHLASFDLLTGAVSPGWFFRPLVMYPVRLIGLRVEVDLNRTAPMLANIAGTS